MGGRSRSSTTTTATSTNLANTSGQTIAGNSGAVTINTVDAGAIAANQTVSSNAIHAMQDTVSEIIAGMGTVSLGSTQLAINGMGLTTSQAMANMLAASNAANAAAAAAAGSSSASSAASSAAAAAAMAANLEMSKYSGGLLAANADSAIELASDTVAGAGNLTMKLMEQDAARSADMIAAINGSQAAAYQFAYEAGRPEAAAMKTSGNVLMVVGGLMAAALLFKGAKG